MNALVLTSLILLQQPGSNPANSVALAVTDIATIDPVTQPFIRYLSMYHVPLADRESFKAAVDFAVNNVSRRPFVTRTAVIGGEVIRVNLLDYKIDPKVWDDFALRGSGPLRSVAKKEIPELYFHFLNPAAVKVVTKKVEKKAPNGGRYVKPDGSPVYEEVEEQVKVANEVVQAPWLSASQITALVLATQSDFPILRADWFLFNANLAPGYYDLLGLKELKDFDNLVRFREGDVLDLQSQAIGTSSREVAHNNRILLRSPTVIGYRWETFDFTASIDEKDLLNNLLTRKRDAGELIATLPNGGQVYFLVNGDNKRIDFADEGVAADTRTPWHRKSVWSGASCMTCHDAGLKQVDDDVRLLGQKKIALLTRDLQDQLRIQDLFNSDISARIKLDQTQYTAYTLAVNGLTPEKNAANFQKWFLQYTQAELTVDDVALEVGKPKNEVLAALRTGVGIHHTLTGLLQTPPRPIRRDQFEFSGFREVMQLLWESKP